MNNVGDGAEANGHSTLDEVYLSIVVLHNHPDAAEKQKASATLASVQRSIIAWEISDVLLRECRDIQSTFFGAQTLRAKIQLSLNEIPVSDHIALRDKLISYLKANHEQPTPAVVTKRLCLALSDFIIQSSSWPTPIEDLVRQFQGDNVEALLEILSTLPEECLTLRLEAARLNDVVTYLKQSAMIVSSLLDNVLVRCKGQPEMEVKILRCLISWVPVLTPQDLVNTHVFEYTINLLTIYYVPDIVHSEACQLVSTTLCGIKGTLSTHCLDTDLFHKIMAFEEGYHTAVGLEDHSRVVNYTKIFTELAEHFIPQIVIANANGIQHYAIRVLDLSLICVGHHDYEVAEITFSMWFKLCEDLRMIPMGVSNCVFQPYVERLILSLCNHSAIEPDQVDLLEDGDEFLDFRNRVFELTHDIVFVVGATNCFRQLLMSLSHSSVTWDTVEATLFVLSSVVDTIPPVESELMPKAIDFMLNLSPVNTHIALLHTSLVFLGQLGEWMSFHPIYFGPVVGYLCTALNNPRLACKAANTLQTLVKRSPYNAITYMYTLVRVVENMDQYSLTNEAAIGLLIVFSSVLTLMPSPQLESTMKRFCWPLLSKLSGLVLGDCVLVIDSKTDPVTWLDRLAVIFKSTSVPEYFETLHPFFSVFRNILPVMLTTCTKFVADVRIMESCVRTIGIALICMGKQSVELLDPVRRMVMGAYSEQHHTCLLHLARILVEMYSHNAQCHAILLDMLNAVIGPTFEVLQQRAQDLHVEEIFALIFKFMERIPTLLLQSPCMVPIVEWALSMTKISANYSVGLPFRFFFDLVKYGLANPTAIDYFMRRKIIEKLIEPKRSALLERLSIVAQEDVAFLEEAGRVSFVLRCLQEPSFGNNTAESNCERSILGVYKAFMGNVSAEQER